ncbi:MAG: hypothetical protein KAJ18_09290 [Candidatus Omnitrophica bacterium]|nr:hypothetical protein [Candidatus Omnitrophota bacterium]
MANAHPDERQIYEQIEKDQIKVPLMIWDLIYHYIGDDITAITHIAASYFKYNEPIEIPSAKKIVEHTQKIRATMDKILHPEKIEDSEAIEDLEKLKSDDMKLHPIIKELFTHYLGNDVYGINMIACFHLDPLGPEPIPVENTQKILDKTRTMKQFLDRLSKATNQEVGANLKKI